MKTWVTSGGTAITRLLFGRSNVYLLSSGTSNILIDTGWAGDRKRLLERLRLLGRPDSVIMTHTHFDHAGNAGMLRDQFRPRFIIVQELEQDFLESGYSPIPRGTMGWTRLIYRLGEARFPEMFRVQGVRADIVFSDRFDLSKSGFDACILHTPGHSPGSSAVVVNDEIALVGDTMGGRPMPVFPPWGDDPAGIIHGWEKLLSTGCHTFHPAHGFPVTRQQLDQAYRKLVGTKLWQAESNPSA